MKGSSSMEVLPGRRSRCGLTDFPRTRSRAGGPRRGNGAALPLQCPVTRHHGPTLRTDRAAYSDRGTPPWQSRRFQSGENPPLTQMESSEQRKENQRAVSPAGRMSDSTSVQTPAEHFGSKLIWFVNKTKPVANKRQ